MTERIMAPLNSRNLSSAMRARIAWVTPDGKIDPAFGDACREARFSLSALKQERFADLAVVDLRKCSITAKTARNLASTARRAAPHGAIIFIADPDLDYDRRRYLRRSGGLVLTHDDPAPLIEACRNRLRRRNIIEEAGERVKSLAAIGELKPLKEEKTPHRPYRVLVAGKPSPTTLNVLSTAQKGGLYVEGVLTPVQALQAIETEKFDCAVFLPSTPSDPLRSLAAMLRRRSKQTDFPVLIASEDALNGEDVLMPSHISDDLIVRITESVKYVRQTNMIRRILKIDRQQAVSDQQTKAVSASFFANHANRLLARARETERPLSLLAFSLEAAPFEGRNASELAAPLDDVTQLISDVTRPEDMLARIAPLTFILSCPFVNACDATRIGERITGILQSTMFKMRAAGTSDHLLFSIGAKVSIIDNWDDLCLEEMVARLLNETAHPRAQKRALTEPA